MPLAPRSSVEKAALQQSGDVTEGASRHRLYNPELWGAPSAKTAKPKDDSQSALLQPSNRARTFAAETRTTALLASAEC